MEYWGKWLAWLGGLTLCIASIEGAPVAPQERLETELVEAWRLPEGPRRWREEARLWFYAGNALPDGDKKAHCFESGLGSARRLREAVPDDPAALFWYAANLSGQISMARNLWALSVMGDLEDTLLKLSREHPHFGYAGGHRVLGVIYIAAACFISFVSHSKAESHFKKALELAPNYPGNWVAWAEWLVERKRYDEARQALDRLRVRGLEGEFGVFWPERRIWEQDIREMEATLRREVH